MQTSPAVELQDIVRQLAIRHGAPYTFRPIPNSRKQMLFVCPNSEFLREYTEREIVQSTTLGLISVSCSGDPTTPLAFDKDQEYLRAWEQNPIKKNSHLWIRDHKKLRNNSLICRNSFHYPEHIHAEIWPAHLDQTQRATFPYGWMNVMWEPVLQLPPQLVESFGKLMDLLDAQSKQQMLILHNALCDHFQNYAINKPDFPQPIDFQSKVFINKLEAYFADAAHTEEFYADLNRSENKEIRDLINSTVPYPLPQNRLATIIHHIKHDHIFDELPTFTTTQTRPLIRIAPFSVTSTATECSTLSRANCLNIFFQLREKMFLDQLVGQLPESDVRNINALSHLLFDPQHSPGKLSENTTQGFQEILRSGYTSTELIDLFLHHNQCQVFFVQGRLAHELFQLPNPTIPMGIDSPIGLPYWPDCLPPRVIPTTQPQSPADLAPTAAFFGPPPSPPAQTQQMPSPPPLPQPPANS